MIRCMCCWHAIPDDELVETSLGSICNTCLNKLQAEMGSDFADIIFG